MLSPRRLLIAFCFCFSLSYSGSAFAWPPTYGFEFNFTNPELWRVVEKRFKRVGDTYLNHPDKGEQKFAVKYMKALARLCSPHCKVTSHWGKWNNWGDYPEYQIDFDDGWWINIAIDPRV